MTKLITEDFSILSTNNFIRCASGDGFYVFAARSTPFENDLIPPNVQNSIQETFYDIHQSMLFAKKITSDDLITAIRRIEWVSGTVYDMYDHEDGHLPNKNFYVLAIDGVNFSVFKCIDNNNGAPSVQKPLLSQTSPSDEVYRTGDGYIWKFMYNIPESIFRKFSTSSYIPFIENEDVKQFAVEGTIERVKLNSGGSGYNVKEVGVVSQVNVAGNTRKLYIQALDSVDADPLNASPGYYTDSGLYIETGSAVGQFRKIIEDGFENNNRYVLLESPFSVLPAPTDIFEIAPYITVRGDGVDFLGKGVIDDDLSSIEKIEIINRGSGYTFGDIIISSNTNTITGQSSDPADAQVIISPKGGHGKRQQHELYGSFATISVDFISDLLPAAENEYRTFGILNAPVYNQVQIVVDDATQLPVSGTIIQEVSGASGTILNKNDQTGVVTIINSVGLFIEGEQIEGTSTVVTDVLFDYVNIDQTFRMNVSLIFEASFAQGEKIIQENTNAEGFIFQIDNNTVKVVEVRGTFVPSAFFTVVGQTSGAIGIINSIEKPDLKTRSSNVLYIQNILPIKRSDDQTERVKLIIGF
jgi:hypothetical protein